MARESFKAKKERCAAVLTGLKATYPNATTTYYEFAARNGELDGASARMENIRSGFRAIRVYLDTLTPVS